MTTLNDISHYMGADLNVSATGDLQKANGTLRGQQRVLRRLLTNQGDYLAHPEYGAGLAQYVGQTADIAKIEALIRSNILLEDCVSKTPAPTITVKPINRGITGGLAVHIQYVDANAKSPVTLSFNVSK
jgi:hypothetical protein